MEERNVIDHSKLIADNTATEYSESTVLTYTQALNEGHTELDGVFNDLVERLDIDKAFGVGLENIGAIVGQDRTVVSASLISFFGFLGGFEATGFGDDNDPSQGGRFREDGEAITGNKRLIDSEYRDFIRIRIDKNHTRSTPEDTIMAFSELFNISPIILDDAIPTTGFATITFTRFLTANEKAILLEGSITSKTVGVKYLYQEVIDPFGFFGFPGALPFGDINDLPITGGSFPRNVT